MADFFWWQTSSRQPIRAHQRDAAFAANAVRMTAEHGVLYNHMGCYSTTKTNVQQDTFNVNAIGVGLCVCWGGRGKGEGGAWWWEDDVEEEG